MKANQYTKRILVAVSGLSPQILTETLYGLAVKQDFIPTEIHLITTAEGAHRAILNLLHQEKGQFHNLCHEYALPYIDFTENNIHIIEDANNNKLNDIRTPEENEAAADFITNKIKELTQDKDSAVHVSIAGGRKTMGYYLGYALSLFGRTQDRLSHVLISEGYEGHPEFYYPTLKSCVIHTRDNRPLDTSKAEITLAEIPFIRMRQDIPKRLLQGKAGFSDTITLARKAEIEPVLVVDVANRLISASGEVFTLPPVVISFYSWLLKQTVETQTSLEKPLEGFYNENYATDFLIEYQPFISEMGSKTTTDGLNKGMESSFFTDRVSRINKELKENLGDRLAQSYRIKGSKHKDSMFYATDLLPNQVSFATIELN